jgi:hypothetical protein
MKPQDILFIIILLAVLVLRKPKYAALLGLTCLILAMPLFQFWVFFTAERLVMYGAAFLLVSCILLGFEKRK